ncbi:MAG TPA: HEAT repeat domain-containing protein [Methanocorpusculum sp.]|nr:HEAT repeat domain-containing protein [Methanocorpusculum sp.]HJK01770.1 HEAT repeat domain-containing protein [Methanocorpusculum sp.]
MNYAEKSSEELVHLLYTEDKISRNAATKELGKRGKEGFALAVPLLADASWIIRYRACEILGLTRQMEALPIFLKILVDPCDHVRYMAVKGLGILGDFHALPALNHMLDDENPFVRRIARKVVTDLSQIQQNR